MTKPSKMIPSLICAGGLCAACALAQSPVMLTVDAGAPGPAIPEDFIGLSFGMKVLPPNKEGFHFFSDTNTSLITLFQNLGLRHLRVGGTTVESPPATPIPGETEIDNLFAFARAAGVKKVIYSFRLLQTDPAQQYAATNAALAKYIWSHYQPYLDCFAIGNEPDRRKIYDQDLTITNFSTYLARWRTFAAAITNAVPEAKFTGPDAGSGNVYWTTRFATAEKNSGLLSAVVEHYYAGGAGKGVDASKGIETMLSPDWVRNNQTLYNKVARPVLSSGLPFRFTEANDHYSGGISGASDTFAGALWALDFLHWWAAHDTSGVDFHNTQWVANDVITHDFEGRLTINPKGYGLKAFELGGHGNAVPVAISNLQMKRDLFAKGHRNTLPPVISNPDGVNLTAYAVRGADKLFVTIINKSHGAGARWADVTIVAHGIARRAEAVFLTTPDGNVATKIGVTLGGAFISNDGPWLGKWTPLGSDQAGRCIVKVPAASAAIVKIATE